MKSAYENFFVSVSTLFWISLSLINQTTPFPSSIGVGVSPSTKTITSIFSKINWMGNSSFCLSPKAFEAATFCFLQLKVLFLFHYSYISHLELVEFQTQREKEEESCATQVENESRNFVGRRMESSPDFFPRLPLVWLPWTFKLSKARKWLLLRSNHFQANAISNDVVTRLLHFQDGSSPTGEFRVEKPSD